MGRDYYIIDAVFLVNKRTNYKEKTSSRTVFLMNT